MITSSNRSLLTIKMVSSFRSHQLQIGRHSLFDQSRRDYHSIHDSYVLALANINNVSYNMRSDPIGQTNQSAPKKFYPTPPILCHFPNTFNHQFISKSFLPRSRICQNFPILLGYTFGSDGRTEGVDGSKLGQTSSGKDCGSFGLFDSNHSVRFFDNRQVWWFKYCNIIEGVKVL